MERIPRPGEFYRHFKNRMYQVLTLATHTETGERLVVYQALYGDFGVYARPLSMFMSPVDREKYPEAAQKDRFERVILGEETRDAAVAGSAEAAEGSTVAGSAEVAEESAVVAGNGTACGDEPDGPGKWDDDSPLSPLLYEFLDAETCEERLALLRQMKGKVGRREVDSLCLSLDLEPGTGGVDDQLENLMKFLKMQQRYDASRLRRR